MKRFVQSAVLAVAFASTVGLANAQDIKIAVVGSITGPNAAYGEQMKHGTEMAVKDINATPQPPFSLRGSSGKPPLARRFRFSFYRAILLLGLDTEAEYEASRITPPGRGHGNSVACAPRGTEGDAGVLQAVGSSGASPNWGAFLQGLSETGYVEGQNVAIEHRIAENKFDRLPAFAAELVGRNVDLIFAPTEPAARAAKNSTATIPIVFGVSVDPVAAGLVTTFARPGGNLTGVSFMLAGLTPKRLELLSELVPPASVFALLVNPNNPNAETIIQEMQEAARVKGVQLHVLKAGTERGIRWWRGAAARVEPSTLLLLRVFGFDRRTQGLLADLGQRWR